MKALVYTAPKTLDYYDMADPKPVEGELLVQVKSVGICGSDMHAFLGHDERRPPRVILGHEASGIIIGGARDGERVTVNPLVTCGHCNACQEGRDNLCETRQIISMKPREGAFADYITVQERNVVRVPDHVSFDQAALVEPIACGWHAVRLAQNIAAKPAQAQRALVIGGGAIGLGAALSLQAQGISDVVIAETNAVRSDFLQTSCAQSVVHPDSMTQRGHFDIVIDGVGFEKTRALASAQVRAGGVIAHIGLGSASGGLDIRFMTLQEVTFIGTYTYSTQDFKDTASAVFDGRLGKLDWIETRPLAEGQAAFNAILNQEVTAPKIILKPN